MDDFEDLSQLLSDIRTRVDCVTQDTQDIRTQLDCVTEAVDKLRRKVCFTGQPGSSDSPGKSQGQDARNRSQSPDGNYLVKQ